jgi:HEAT repeat protein
MTDKIEITFEEINLALLDLTTPFPGKYLHKFSDISPKNLSKLKTIWKKIDHARRFNLLSDLEDLLDADTLVNFDELAKFAMDDLEGDVRAAAIRLLWECEDIGIVPLLLDKLKNDPDFAVRAQAAISLGLFVYRGELDKIPSSLLNRIVDHLIVTYNSNDHEIIRQKALESLGYSTREVVSNFISTAFQSTDEDWKASALCAMGRSADEKWTNQVISYLPHPNLRLQIEAVRAAGEIEIPEARPLLLKLANSRETDEDLWTVAVWSLSQIGGDQVKETIEKLINHAKSDEELTFLEDALENLSFTEGLDELNLLNPDAKDRASKFSVIDFSNDSEDYSDEDLEFDDFQDEYEDED